jgi:hypothetical protein
VVTFLLVCGAVGGPLFVVAFLAEGFTRAGYDQLRQPVSALALGKSGWTQKANFIVTGLLMLAFGVGLWTDLRPNGVAPAVSVLVGLYALGLIGAGIFVTDPVGDYQPDGKVVSGPNLNGSLHTAFSMVVFIALPAACFVLAGGNVARGSIGWAVYSAATGVLFVAGLVFTSIGFFQATQSQPHRQLAAVAGLLQRITIATGWGWLTLVAVHLLGGF